MQDIITQINKTANNPNGFHNFRYGSTETLNSVGSSTMNGAITKLVRYTELILNQNQSFEVLFKLSLKFNIFLLIVHLNSLDYETFQ